MAEAVAAHPDPAGDLPLCVAHAWHRSARGSHAPSSRAVPCRRLLARDVAESGADGSAADARASDRRRPPALSGVLRRRRRWLLVLLAVLGLVGAAAGAVYAVDDIDAMP